MIKRLLRYLLGFSVYGTLNWLFDYVVYTAVIWYSGLLWGGILMCVLAFLLDYYSVKFYDYSQTDWLMLKYLKSLKEYDGRNKLKRLTKFVLTKTSPAVQIIFFSIKFNPFITTIMMRKDGFHQQGISRQDWKIFIISHTIGQIYWILLIALGIEGVMFFL